MVTQGPCAVHGECWSSDHRCCSGHRCEGGASREEAWPPGRDGRGLQRRGGRGLQEGWAWPDQATVAGHSRKQVCIGPLKYPDGPVHCTSAIVTLGPQSLASACQLPEGRRSPGTSLLVISTPVMARGGSEVSVRIAGTFPQPMNCLQRGGWRPGREPDPRMHGALSDPLDFPRISCSLSGARERGSDGPQMWPALPGATMTANPHPQPAPKSHSSLELGLETWPSALTEWTSSHGTN
jgi:hypothetical protein